MGRYLLISIITQNFIKSRHRYTVFFADFSKVQCSSMFSDEKSRFFCLATEHKQNITPRPNAYEKFAFLWKILVTPKGHRTKCFKFSRRSLVPIFGAKAHANRRLNRQYTTHFRQNPRNSGNTKIKRKNSLDKLFALCNNMFTVLLYGIFL